ncbi:MAG TPA: DUF1559 domain-containing protein [Thermoguttaceae bacterium]|nr:DUF1559 domain-containing protein [Thermoguttaceae bacterium]
MSNQNNTPSDQSWKTPFQFDLRDVFLAFAFVAVTFGTFGTPAIVIGPYLQAFIWRVRVAWSTQRPAMILELLLWMVPVAGWLVFLVVADPSEPLYELICRDNVKQISRGIQRYIESHEEFPTACTTGEKGQPMHSWRVDLLPYMGDNSLWSRYDYGEPWSGPNNSKLSYSMPGEYLCLSDPNRGPPIANYAAVVGPGTAWPAGGGVRFEDLRDGASQTIILAEVSSSGIHWMEPRDLAISDLARKRQSASQLHVSSGHSQPCVLFADGSVRNIARDVSPEVLVGLATIDGGEQIDAEELEATWREKAKLRQEAADITAFSSFVLMLIVGGILAFRPLRKWPHEDAGDLRENHEGHRGREESSG